MEDNKIKNRYDFVLVFDVLDGNPNGDPDAGNLPRIDPETGMGLVTDVCLKRKVRNYVQIKKTGDNGPENGFDIYIKEKAVLGDAHFKAFKDLGFETGEEKKVILDQNQYEAFNNLELPDGLLLLASSDEESALLVVTSVADKNEIKKWIKDENPPKTITSVLNVALKEAKTRQPTAEESLKGKTKMCQDYYDIRTFGAVLSLKSAPNCGQVRGPVQLTFGRSVDPVVTLEHCITRMAVATQKEAESQSGDNRTMGRKNTIPYGVYVAHGFVSAHLASQTGFDENDLQLFWEALTNMFEHDRSAARGLMSTRKLIVFKHSSPLGSAPAHKLFDRVKISRKPDLSMPPRSFDDYIVEVDKGDAGGVEIIEKL